MPNSACKKEYQKPVQFDVHGVPFKRYKTYTTAEGRKKTRITFGGALKKAIPKKVDIWKRANEELSKTVVERAWNMAIDYRTEILSYAKENTGFDITLDTFFFLFRRDIALKKNWAGKLEKFEKIWDSDLREAVGSFALKSSALNHELTDSISQLTQRHKNHRELEEQEINYWICLGGMLEYAVENGVISENPIADMYKKAKERLTTKASEDLSKRSLTFEEFADTLNILYTNIDNTGYSAILIRALTGIPREEICGLNLSDLKTQKLPTNPGETAVSVAWLDIAREYRKKGKTYQLRNLLESKPCYRRYPCSDIVAALTADQLRIRKRSKATADDPLFVEEDGSRLRPDTMSALEKQLIKMVVKDKVRLEFIRNQNDGYFRGDMLRQNASFWLRSTRCVNDAEFRVLLGLTGQHTYARYYIDWTFPYVLAVIAQKITLYWHRQFFCVSGKSTLKRETQPINCKNIKIDGTAAEDCCIRLKCDLGLSIYSKEVA